MSPWGGDSKFWGWGGTGPHGGGQHMDGVGSPPILDNPGVGLLIGRFVDR